MQDKKTLGNQVENVLASHPNARNDDDVLMAYLVRDYYFSAFDAGITPFCQNVEPSIGYGTWRQEDAKRDILYIIGLIKGLPNRESVRRWRAHIQNTEKRYLPTEEHVAVQRGWNAMDWKAALFLGNAVSAFDDADAIAAINEIDAMDAFKEQRERMF